MGNTENIGENNSGSELFGSCCGKTYNGPSSDILDYIFVDDNFVKREAVLWIQKNLKNYKFVGKEAKALKKRLETSVDSKIYSEQLDKILSEFFALFANNPFCAENGISILENSYIIGNKLDCYFVVYKKGIIIPIGCLELFAHEQVKSVQNNFVDATKRAALKTSYQSTIMFEEMKVNLDKSNGVRLASLPRFVLGLATFVLSLIYVIVCLAGIDWANFEYYSVHSTDIFQAIRFAAEEGFGISHNSNLSLVLLALGIFWLLHMLIRNIKFVKEFKNYKNADKFKKVKKSLSFVEGNLDTVDSKVKEAAAFVTDNIQSFKKIFLTPNFPEKKFGPKLVNLEQNRDIVYDSKTMNRVLPKTFTLILSLCLVLSSLVFVGKCKNDEIFNEKVSSSFMSKSGGNSSSELFAINNYITVSEADIYTKDYPESLVLYHLNEGATCTVIDDVSNELYSKVSFSSDEGYLIGWISKQTIRPYHPKQDNTLYKKIPFDVYASSSLESDGYVPYNTIDGKLSTVWQEGAYGDGSGEWIRYDFDGESTMVSSIGIYNGDARSHDHYYNNGRAIEILIRFYKDSETVVDTLSYCFEDGVFEMQYINLNRPVEVSAVEIELISVSEDYYYPDACISEVEFYCVNPDVQ